MTLSASKSNSFILALTSFSISSYNFSQSFLVNSSGIFCKYSNREFTYHSDGIEPSTTKFEDFIKIFNSFRIFSVVSVVPSSKSVLTNLL